MDRNTHAHTSSRQAPVPPAIAVNSGREEAADAARADGNPPGSKPAHYSQGRGDAADGPVNEGHLLAGGGDEDFPGQQPDEIVPDKGDVDVPEQTPDEVAPGQGDFDRPDRAPPEMPPQPDGVPVETPPPD